MTSVTYADLKGKVVLITGSSKALGAETARQFAASGARVVVNGRDEQAIERVTGSIRSEGGECIGIAADATSADELIRLQREIQDRFGDVSVLATFAGGLGNPVPVLNITEEQWRKTIDADLTSKFLTVKTFVPAMKANLRHGKAQHAVGIRAERNRLGRTLRALPDRATRRQKARRVAARVLEQPVQMLRGGGRVIDRRRTSRGRRRRLLLSL